MATIKQAERLAQEEPSGKTAMHWKDNRSLRARVLNAMADRFEARAEQLAELLATEVGKILPHARFETTTVPFNLRFNAALALTEYGRAAEVDADGLSIVIRQPIGVAGIFAPWNAPIALGIRSLAPALAAGCSAAVILPKETAQVNALIGEVISDTDDLPPVWSTLLPADVKGWSTSSKRRTCR